MKRGGIVVAICALACVAALAPAAASAEDAPYVPWNQLLPALPGDFTASTFSDCADGSPKCIDATLDEMWRRFHRVVGTCNDNAVFALTYIRVTEDYKAADARNFYDDPRYLAREDKTFAQLYFNAYDNWRAGRADLTPAAWRIAFDAAQNHEVNALGNLLMAMNAHVNRDMPFMIAGLGLVTPDGRSRKPDHDRFNELLNLRFDQILHELSLRFDPSTDDLDVPGVVDNIAFIQILQGWREQVWRHAELLLRAGSDAARRAVSDYIEDYAYSIGREVARFFKNGDQARRAKTCALSGGQRPYNFTPPHLGEDPAADPPAQTTGAAEPEIPSAGLRMSRAHRVRVVLRCPGEPGPCTGRLVLVRRRGAQRMAAASFRLPAGSRQRISLALGPGARAMLRRSPRVAGEVRVRTPVLQTREAHVTTARTTVRGDR